MSSELTKRKVKSCGCPNEKDVKYINGSSKETIRKETYFDFWGTPLTCEEEEKKFFKYFFKKYRINNGNYVVSSARNGKTFVSSEDGRFVPIGEEMENHLSLCDKKMVQK